MDLKNIAQSLMGALNAAPNYGANVNDTAAGGVDVNSQTANIRALGALYSRGAIAKQGANSVGSAAGQQAENEAAQRKVAAAEAEAAEEAKVKELKRLQDPDEYKRIVNKVGGYDFFDPLGNKISAVDYAQKVNKQVTDVYKDSQDPNDEDFINDYKRVKELGGIIQSGDAKARDKFYEKNPDFKKAYANSTYTDIVKDLRAEYPGYFRSDKEGDNAAVGTQRLDQLKSDDDKKKNFLQKAWSGIFGK